MSTSLQIDRVVGLVLAGGRSLRLGRDKTKVEFRGESLPARSRRRLRALTKEVLVADGEGGADSVQDGPGKGPAAGILGAALVRPGQPLLVLACDLPWVSEELLTRLMSKQGDWVVPRWQGHLEPLCSLYRKAALESLGRQVAEGGFSLQALALDPALRVNLVAGSELRELGDPARLFLNINTPTDLARLRESG